MEVERSVWYAVLALLALGLIGVLWLDALVTWGALLFAGCILVGALYEQRMRRFAPDPEPDNPHIAEVFD